ncbi:hypothetical protein BDR22DRAFT_401059 [Usnea florida]
MILHSNNTFSSDATQGKVRQRADNIFCLLFSSVIALPRLPCRYIFISHPGAKFCGTIELTRLRSWVTFGSVPPKGTSYTTRLLRSQHSHFLRIRLSYGKAEYGLVFLPCADKFMHLRLVYARLGTRDNSNVAKGPTWRIRPRTSLSSVLLLA